MTPFEITVLMPVYNGEKYLREAIDSVLSQTFSEFEFLIINDGSTDSTEEIIKSYTDPRIKLINQKNGGVSAALNTGLKNANGKYIARFDADDICFPNRLQVQYDFMINNPDYILVGSDAEYMTEEGEYIFTYKNIGHSDEEIKSKIMLYCPFVHSTVFYKKDLVIKLDGYNKNAHSFEDYFLWINLINLGKVYNFENPLIKVRFNPASVTIDEKDRDPLFNEIKKKVLFTRKITDEDGKQLLLSIKKISHLKKISSYHRILGKKYLWNNYQPKKARKHLLKAILTEPFSIQSYSLMLFSFLPKTLILKIYKLK